jgi:HAD superfamily hydrolase (TIGR01544 family)
MKNYLNGFICQDQKRVSRKIQSFINSGSGKIHLVLDFDQTLTVGDEAITWGILARHLKGKGQKEQERLYSKYRPIEAKGKMKPSHANAWWNKCLKIYKENKLKWSDITKDVEKNMPARKGAKELFDVCNKKGIPSIIISAGIRDMIELWCQKFEVSPSVILSTNLFFDSQGFVSGWDEKSVIHIFNKKEMGHKEISKIRKSRPKTILVGDSIEDADIVDGNENVLRIIVDDPRIDDISRGKAFYEDVFKKFDLLIKNKSLEAVVDIIKLFH